MELLPLRQMIDEYVLKALIAFNGNRTKAAAVLKISVRAVRLYVNRLEAKGYAVPGPEQVLSAWHQKQRANRRSKL